MSARLLELDSVSIWHHDSTTPTPDGVTLTVSQGEVVLLLGPSGSGKSTLALALNGLIPQAVAATLEGRIEAAGLDTARTPVGVLCQHVGMVFQDPDAQIVTGTVLDEVCFGPENLLLDLEEVLGRAESALRTVGLWERRFDNPDVLSGGQRQRLAIACALTLHAPLLVLDEPTANLDSAGVEDVYRTLAELVAGGEQSIVLIEHNLDAAMDLVDRVVVLDRDGKVVMAGPARSTLTEHASELLDLGVWLPVATRAALQLRTVGLSLTPLPLTPTELGAALEACEHLPDLPCSAPEETADPPPHPGQMMSEPIVRVDRLQVSRGGRAVLRDISLNVGAGEWLAIVGTNGAGKTTLLQSIAGILRPPRGRIEVGGLDPARASARALSQVVGFVFQNPEHQFVRYTVADELACGLRVMGVAEHEIKDRVETMLVRLGLQSHRDRHPFTLSGGQKRRLSVGTALIVGPPVLALDEPTYGQDRERAMELMGLLSSLNAEGVTIVMVAHDMQLVADYATRLAVLDRGRLLVDGPTKQVLEGEALIDAGLRLPPLAAVTRSLRRHCAWNGMSGLGNLPGCRR